jgi:hypothetical protein
VKIAVRIIGIDSWRPQQLVSRIEAAARARLAADRARRAPVTTRHELEPPAQADG